LLATRRPDAPNPSARAQPGRARSEEDDGWQWPAATPGGGGHTGEELLTALRKGALALKHGRQGRPKVHFFRLSAGDAELQWRSASGAVRAVGLAQVREVLPGQATELFRRVPLHPSARSFSLRYAAAGDGGGADGVGAASRTLDLSFADAEQHNLWLRGIRLALQRLRAPAAVTSAESAGVGESAHAAHAAATAAVLDPGDLFLWGSAGRGAAAAPSNRDAAAWPGAAAPAPAPRNARLDVAAAAAGRRHGALVTAAGALYTFGEGRGGKLGLGHSGDAPAPARVRQGLPGRGAVTAVACGDDCTAAVAEGGALYMWGRLPGEGASAALPTPVRGGLAGREVVQVHTQKRRRTMQHLQHAFGDALPRRPRFL
jgi:hypothetical protein